jgi:hypothetical protein
MEKSWRGEAFRGLKRSSVLSKLSLRWWADIQAEISVRHAGMRVTTWVKKWGKEESS